MWSWIMGLADRLVWSFDNGSFFRKPWRTAYTLIALVLGALAVAIGVVALGGGIYACFKLYEEHLYIQGVQVVEVGSLFSIAVLFLGLLVARLWWLRSADLEVHTEGHRNFLTGPIVAHVVRTYGEAMGLLIGLGGVLGYLCIWPIGNVVNSIPLLGPWLAQYTQVSPIIVGSALVTGFLTIMLTRWIAEVIEVLFAIANNTRALRQGADATPLPERPKVATMPFAIHLNGLLIGAFVYLMIALPLHESVIMLPALVLLGICTMKRWHWGLAFFASVVLIVLVRSGFTLLAKWDNDSVAHVFLEKGLPLLIVLLALVVTAITLMVLDGTGRLKSSLDLGKAWAMGAGIAVLYTIYPAVHTINEAMKRHELTATELQMARDLFKDYGSRRYGWRVNDRVDTTSTFVVTAPRIEADKYGKITVAHELNTGRQVLITSFECMYTNISLPDSLTYHSRKDPVVVRFMHGDSIGFRAISSNSRFVALAVDMVQQLQKQQDIEREEIFNSYRDSLNQLLDTLSGVFLSYDCTDGTCFAWFDANGPEGVVKRSLYCPSATINGYPINAIPKDGEHWTIVTRETVVATPAAIAAGRGPMIYELFDLRPVAQASAPTVAEPPVKSPSVQSVPKPTNSRKAEYEPQDVDEKPVYPGGVWKYLATRKYPAAEKASGVVGKVRVAFTVNTDGSVSNVQVIRPSGYKELDAESVRLVNAMQRWTPGMKDGHAVAVRMVHTVDFSLNE